MYVAIVDYSMYQLRQDTIVKASGGIAASHLQEDLSQTGGSDLHDDLVAWIASCTCAFDRSVQ